MALAVQRQRCCSCTLQDQVSSVGDMVSVKVVGLGRALTLSRLLNLGTRDLKMEVTSGCCFLTDTAS